MKVMFIAAAAIMALSAGTAIAGDGGGNGGDRLGDPNAAPLGFYSGVPGYDNQRSAEAYVINQERNWFTAHAGTQNPVAQTQSSSAPG